jgi:multisubunit Na+/H+ antiporter MnhB subunit
VTTLTQVISKLLLLPILAIAVAVLVKGYAYTGDGFSAGVIAATGILLQYLAFGYHHVEQRLPIRYAPFAITGGLLLAFLVGFLPAVYGKPVFSHVPAPNHEVIHLGSLELHSAVLFDVGVFLIVVGFSVHVMSLIVHVVDRKEE